MRPFGRFSKLKGQQKERSEDDSHAGASLEKDRDHVPSSQRSQELDQSKDFTAKCDVSVGKTGQFDEKAQQKGSVRKPSNLGEWSLSMESSRKSAGGLQARTATASKDGDSTLVENVEKNRVEDAKGKAAIWGDDNNLNVALCIPLPGNTDKNKLEEQGESKYGLSSTTQMAQIVTSPSSDLETSTLTRSLGLNRIKTRSGPLYEDGLDRETEVKSLQRKSFKVDKARVSEDEGSESEGPACKGLDGVNRSHVAEPCKTSIDMSFHDQDMALRSLQGKSRRKSKADSERPQRGRSGRRTSDAMLVCSRPISSTEGKTEDCAQSSSKELSENILEKSVPSRLLSYLDNQGDKSFEGEICMEQLDVIKETESAKFVSVPQISEVHMSKRWPKDIKSFSHELGPRGRRLYDIFRPHSDNDLEELLAALRARFNTAKEEVDAELNLFAADLVEILDRNGDPFPQWQENVEDLLLLARRCTLLSPIDFRSECENIVHELDDRRQELPMGLLKQLHTRMLFILTRCTRLLQFQKEPSPQEEGFHKVQQCLKGVPSLDRSLLPIVRRKGKAAINSRKLLPEVLEQTARSDVGLSKVKSSKHTFSVGKARPNKQQQYSPKVAQSDSTCLVDAKRSTDVTRETFPTSGDYNLDGEGLPLRSYDSSGVTHVYNRWARTEGDKVNEDAVHPVITSPSKQAQKTPWFDWTDSENLVEESDSVICRICEEEVRTSHLEPHSLRCTLADTCDIQGLNSDERLRMLADNLEKIAELSTPKSNQTAAEESPERLKRSKAGLHDGFDSASPQLNDLQEKVIGSRSDDMCASDTASVEEPRGLSLISFKRLLGSKADQGMASSSAGSGTPRSSLTTPRASQLDLLWAEQNGFTEPEDISQIHELAGIARRIVSKSASDEGALDYFETCLEELHDILARNKIEDLTVDTFGKRIENILREKIYLLSATGDHRRLELVSSPMEDDGMSTDDGAQSFKSTPIHLYYKDRITIEDFEILKPISRGAFGTVFLARKRATGDLFAIKVLRKIDMIRKNAVENILAERDILITVCNPFVVRFFYSFTSRDNLYLVMEYLNGGDLYSLLRHMGCLEEHVTRVYIAELVLALEYLHSLGVVHRDLKPDNILIAHDGHIKLTDFGLSKVGLINSTDDLSGPGVNDAVLMEETIFVDSGEQIMQREHHKKRYAVGTPDYLAPEILLGTEHGYTADWWSVGAILFECLTGLPPFNAEHPQIIFDNILNRKIPWPNIPEDMSYEAKDLIDKLLTEDPNQRLGSKGASEVKNHPFFKDVSWDSLARQKAAFVPSPESVEDTSYFTSRHLEGYAHSSPQCADSSDSSTSSSSSPLKAILDKMDDECGDLVDFGSSPSVEHTFNNFSFKNLSQLMSINYDLLLQTGKDSLKGHAHNQSGL